LWVLDWEFIDTQEGRIKHSRGWESALQVRCAKTINGSMFAN